MFNLMTGRNSPMPFSDWCAQVDRLIQRNDRSACIDRNSDVVKACYNCGLSPREIADTWEDYNA